jgi:hypothetical protein
VKNALAAALILAALGAAAPADAQVFGQFTPGAVVPVNGHVFGAYLTASENVTGGLAQLRLSFYPNLDFGFHGGLTRLDLGPGIATRTTLRVGGDVRWQVANMNQGARVDVAAGGALGVETADHFKVVTLGPSVVASRPLAGGGIVPYAGTALNFISRDVSGHEATDLSLPLRFGMDARLAPGLHVVAELQLLVVDRYNDDVAFATGVNLPF